MSKSDTKECYGKPSFLKMVSPKPVDLGNYYLEPLEILFKKKTVKHIVFDQLQAFLGEKLF